MTTSRGPDDRPERGEAIVEPGADAHVSGMLYLQAGAAEDAELRAALAEASGRVSAVGRAYERLSYDADIENIDLGAYLQKVCADVTGTAPHCVLDFQAAPGIALDADRAIALALLVNELVTNAAKYAFPDRSAGHVWVHLARRDASDIRVSVRDDGIGLPPEFDISKSKGLGMRIVTALTSQLGGSITQHTSVGGTEFVLLVPLKRSNES